MASDKAGDRMIVDKRRDLILTALEREGTASVQELARSLDVSESTIRRDLEMLDRNGELVRTYGGARLRPRQTVRGDVREEAEEGAFDPTRNLTDKQRVAAAAAELVADDSVILLDIGTTTPLLARRLRGRRITVITGNLAVVDELRQDDAVRLVVLGGVLRRNYQSLVGSLTAQMLAQIGAEQVFLSCTGVRPSGQVLDNMAVEAPIKQSMIEAANQVVLLATAAKFPGTGALRICDLSEVDVMISTAGAPEPTLDLCRSAGGRVIIAP